MRRLRISATAICAVVAVAIAGLILSNSRVQPAQSETRCASRVISDWAVDGTITGRYRLSCYRAALRSLPNDLRSYSNAPDDIDRALRRAASRT